MSNVKSGGSAAGVTNVKPMSGKQVRVGPIRTPFNKSITRKTSR